MYACIKHGFNKKVCNPCNGKAKSTGAALSGDIHLTFPDQGWVRINEAFHAAAEESQLNTGHAVDYFVTHTVTNSLPTADFKPTNKSAESLFRCGHVQGIEVCSTDKHSLMKAKCIPEMRKYRIYVVQMALAVDSFNIV